jgi:Ca-activated chloride channel family protein
MNLAHPHFAEPRWLWLAVLAPVVLMGLNAYSRWRRKEQLERLALPEILDALLQSHSPFRRFLKNILLVLVVTLVGVALARPQWGEQEESGRTLGQDIVFALDCSRSMLAADITPSRLQRARLAILDFAQRSPHGRLGLVVFAGQAFLQCPLTYDYNAFQETLLSVDEKIIPVPGTDIGRAIEEAAQAMDKQAQQKILVLITDGEDLEKGGVREAQTVATNGVKIFTVGVGTPAGAEIQVVNEQGRTELLRDSKGEVVRSHLDETTLRAIAQATGGTYNPLGSLGEGLSRVRLSVEKMSTVPGSAPGRRFGVDRFHVPLAIALSLLIVESLIGTRRTRASRAGRPGPTPRSEPLAYR